MLKGMKVGVAALGLLAGGLVTGCSESLKLCDSYSDPPAGTTCLNSIGDEISWWGDYYGEDTQPGY